jgi:hypothetical protein
VGFCSIQEKLKEKNGVELNTVCGFAAWRRPEVAILRASRAANRNFLHGEFHIFPQSSNLAISAFLFLPQFSPAEQELKQNAPVLSFRLRCLADQVTGSSPVALSRVGAPERNAAAANSLRHPSPARHPWR